MREKNRNSIESNSKLPQFTTMNVIDGQAGLVIYSSLIFYSLTIDNILNIIILLVLAGITVASLTGDNGLIGKTGEAKKQTEISEGLEQLEIAVNQSFNKRGNIDTAKLAKNLSKINGLKYINGENQEIDISENTEIDLTAKVKLKGYNYKINPGMNPDFCISEAFRSIQ